MLDPHFLARAARLARCLSAFQHRLSPFRLQNGADEASRRFSARFRRRRRQPKLPKNPAIVPSHPRQRQRTVRHLAFPRPRAIARQQHQPDPAVLPLDPAHLRPCPAQQILGDVGSLLASGADRAATHPPTAARHRTPSPTTAGRISAAHPPYAPAPGRSAPPRRGCCIVASHSSLAGRPLLPAWSSCCPSTAAPATLPER